MSQPVKNKKPAKKAEPPKKENHSGRTAVAIIIPVIAILAIVILVILLLPSCENSTYTLTLISNNTEMGLAVSGAGTYKAGKDAYISAKSNKGYKFLYWTDETGEVACPSANGTYKMPKRDVTLTANFDYRSYRVELSGPGTCEGAGDYKYKDEVTISFTPSVGHIFMCWAKDGEPESYESTYTFVMPAEDVSYAAWVSNANFTIYVTSSNPDIMSFNKDGTTLSYGSFTTIVPSFKNLEDINRGGVVAYYDYTGGVKGDLLISNSDAYGFTMPNHDVYLYAQYGEKMKVDINCGVGGTVAGPTYVFKNTSNTYTANGYPFYQFDKFECSDELEPLFEDNKVTIFVRDLDVSFDAYFKPTAITMGEYPQTVVSDASLINALKQITTRDSDGYINFDGDRYYGYEYSNSKYTGGATINFPSGASLEVLKGEDTTTLYFKVEPIKWRYHQINSTTNLYFSEYVIDSESYGTFAPRFEGDQQPYYNSHVRDFLNNDFVNRAFNDNEVSKLAQRTYSMNLSFVNTAIEEETKLTDKIFLPSHFDLESISLTGYGKDADPKRATTFTDFAYIKQNISTPDAANDVSYMTRNVLFFNFDQKECEYYTSDGGLKMKNLCNDVDRYGVRPMMFVNLMH